jgi:hypothetical protein
VVINLKASIPRLLPLYGLWFYIPVAGFKNKGQIFWTKVF